MTAFQLTRRNLLVASGSLVASALVPRIAAAMPGRDPRFLFIFLRGGLDGLAAVAPVGDPNYEAARGGLEFGRTGENAGLPLDDTFVLNPNMPFLAALFQRREAAIVHAVATPYRDRSHFDGQDVVETGLGGVGSIDSGWMNRMIGRLGTAGHVVPYEGLAIGSQLPIAMRGPAQVVTWLPPGYPAVKEDLRIRLLDLYRDVDPKLASRLETALRLDRAIGGEAALAKAIAAEMKAGRPRGGPDFRSSGLAAGNLMARPDGPRIAIMSFTGWDTHSDERPLVGQLGKGLASLDVALEGFAHAMEPVWKDTVVVVATEFGRTVRMNGTDGSDHGTASVSFILGGSVKGGRVIGDWPGLAEARLYEKRDLLPTTDLRAVFKSVARDHLGLDTRELAEVVFPESTAIAPLDNLIG
jgi:uncharacterized protein (DUF1501 family)